MDTNQKNILAGDDDYELFSKIANLISYIDLFKVRFVNKEIGNDLIKKISNFDQICS